MQQPKSVERRRVRARRKAVALPSFIPRLFWVFGCFCGLSAYSFVSRFDLTLYLALAVPAVLRVASSVEQSLVL